MSALTPGLASIDRGRLAGLLDRELDRFRAEHPRSLELHERSQGSLLFGVPMSWMARWAGGFPAYLDEAQGARVKDVDGPKSGQTVKTPAIKRARPAVPRKVVGELVVLRVEGRTATAVVTRVAQEIHTGDAVEIQ